MSSPSAPSSCWSRRSACRPRARVLVVGASYKPGVRDMRESPAVRIMRALAREGVERRLPRPARALARVDDSLALLSVARPHAADYDLAVLVTLHDGFDYSWLGELRAGARLHLPHSARPPEVPDLWRILLAGGDRRGRVRPVAAGQHAPAVQAVRLAQRAAADEAGGPAPRSGRIPLTPRPSGPSFGAPADPVVQPRAARRLRAVPDRDRGRGGRLQDRLHRDGRGGSVLRRLQHRRLRLHPEPLRCSACSTGRRPTRPRRSSRRSRS